ncbi:putative ribonuclease H-like domain-containing protein [Tanacetum coccineum]
MILKGFPHPLSGDNTPKPQEDIDDIMYVMENGSQKPEISVSDENSSEHSTCQSNDSEGSCENTSKHIFFFETESESLKMNQNEMSKSRPKVNSVRPNINTGRTNISSGRSKVNTVSPKVNSVRPTSNIGDLLLRPQQVIIGGTLGQTSIIIEHPLKNMVDRGIFDSGCSGYMTGNKDQLEDFEEFNGGSVTFGGSKGYMSGKGRIRVGNLDFDSVSFVKELGHFNLFSILQICDKQHKVLFTETECLMVSSDFKMPDENQILLKVPRHHNMYSFDMKTPSPAKGFACLITKATSDESKLWHRRLGHINFKNLNKLVKGNLVRGLPSKVFQIKHHTCVPAKKANNIGPLARPKFCWVFFLASKDETSGILQTFIRQIENQLSHRVKIIRSDNGTEFKNRDMLEFCGNKGIKQEYSNARTPQQNGVAERMNRTLIEAARTMLADSLLPTTFWAEAVSTACYIFNRVRVTKPQHKTPYELLFGHKPIISYIRPFGCHVTILDTLSVLGKFDRKSDEGFLVGYSLNSKAYRVYNLVTKRVEVNLHVNFLEEKPNVKGVGYRWMFDIDYLTDSMNYIPVSLENQANNAGISEETNSAGTSQTPESIASEEKDEEVELIVVPSAVKIPEEKDESRTTSKNSKPEETLTEPQKEMKDSSTNPKIQAFRRELEEIALKHLGNVPENNTTSTHSVNTGSKTVNTGRLDHDDSLMPELEIFHKPETGIFDEASYDGSHTQKQQRNNHKDQTALFDAMFSIFKRNQKKSAEALQDNSWSSHARKNYLTSGMKIEAESDEEVYVSQPPGFIDPDHLQKFIRDKKDIMLVQVYVDDIIFGSTNKSWCAEFEALMKSRFQMRFHVNLTFFLGLQVKQNKVNSKDFSTRMLSRDTSVSPGKPKLGLWYPRESPFDLEAFSDSDYGGSNLDRKSTTAANCCGQEVFLLLDICAGIALDDGRSAKYGSVNVNTGIAEIVDLLRGSQPQVKTNAAVALSHTTSSTPQGNYTPPITTPIPPPITTPTPPPITTPIPPPITTPTPPPIPTPTTIPGTDPTPLEHIYKEQSPVHHDFSPPQEQAPSQMPMDDLLHEVPKLISRIGRLEMGSQTNQAGHGKCHSEGRKSQDDPLDSSAQGLVTPPTTKSKNTSGEEQVEEISPNTLEKQPKLSQVASLKTNTASAEGVNTGSIKFSIVGDHKGQREGKAPMISEETPKKSKEQILQEEASLTEAIRLDSLLKEEEAKQIHLDSLLAQRIAEEEELTEQQKKRKSSSSGTLDAKMMRIAIAVENDEKPAGFRSMKFIKLESRIRIEAITLGGESYALTTQMVISHMSNRHKDWLSKSKRS